MTDDAALTAAGEPRTPRGGRILLIVAAVVTTALVAALIILVQRSSAERDAALVRTQHSYEIVTLTGEVDGALARAEASLGRFVVDGERSTGSIYYDQWRHAGIVLERLTPLVAEDAAQAARMRQLEALYAKRGEELALPAARANYKQGLAALALFARAGRSDTLPEIARLLHEVADAERARLDRRSTAAASRTERANDLAQLLSIVGILLALSVLALGWLAVQALAEQRIARDSADLESGRSAVLERAVAERTVQLSEANNALIEAAAIRDEAEAKLRQVQKMEAIGQLTGGIAHDFNNMLAVVLGGLELARRRVEEHTTDALGHIDSAIEGATRAAALTRRLLSFARAEPLLPSATDPRRLLTGLSGLIDRSIGERIGVTIAADPDVWPVWIDPYQLENALLNLAVNARDAMHGEGVLTMRAANVTLAAGEINELPAGGYVRIAVTDDGVGMSQATLDRVFEPFFTTKPAGEGTGLGLSQILGFARQSGGDVAIASAEGRGTTVSIYLPRHHGAVAIEQRGEQPLAPAVASAGTIIVVEDDPRVRGATDAALRELGYTTSLCASGEEALTRLRERPDTRLVVTDVVMPGMSGPELVDQIHGRYPDIGVLFVTGYVGEAGEAENFAGHAVLRKPFTIRAIGEAVAAALA